MTPKTAARILRVERACRTIMDERPSLADTALTCGYQDQAQMTREWRALAGCTRRAWIARELPELPMRLFGDPSGRLIGCLAHSGVA